MGWDLVRRLLALLLVGGLAACGPGQGLLPDDDDDPVVDPTDHVYDPDRLMSVQIDIDPTDWDALRTQTRDGWAMLSAEDCLAEPWGSPFTWFGATVTLDGEVFEDVGVRKKGFLGSLSELKPGLKIDLSEYGQTAEFSGAERLTLNNAISDPSFLRQCLGYGFYRDAGLPASRCSYATVEVNGEYLGVYVNVEPIKKPMLERYFGDDGGNLYEGTLSDFREGWSGTFEKKTNEEQDDWSDIEALVAALETDDDGLLDALEPVLDLDAFFLHWAAEVLSSHTDGYAWNTNNYYLYADPTDGRLHFIPWGIDAILYGASGEGTPASVFAYGYLANRLFELPEGRARYHAALEGLLDGPWDEEVFTDRMERDLDLIRPHLNPGEQGYVQDEADLLEHRMQLRRGEVQEALDDGEVWELGLRNSFCFETLGELDAGFSTTWGSDSTQDVFTYGDGDFAFDLDGESFSVADPGAVAGDYEGQPILYVAGWMSETEAALIYMSAPYDFIAPGVFDVAFGETLAALLYIDTATMQEWAVIAYVVGQVELTQAGLEFGDPIEGTVTGELLSWGW